MLFQTFSDSDGEKGFDEVIAALEAGFLHELVAVIFRHVAKSGVNEGIGHVVNAREVKNHRFKLVPYALHPQRHETIAHMPISEEIPELCCHVDFLFHNN